MTRRLIARLLAWLSHPVDPDAWVEYRVRQIDPTAWEREVAA